MADKVKRASWEIPVLIVLFLFAISVFNLAGYIFTAMVAVMLFFNVTRLKITAPEILLVCFSAWYYLFFAIHNGVNIEDLIVYLIGPVMAYILGKLYIEKAQSPNVFLIFILVLSAGMCLHGFLNWYAYTQSEHFALYEFYRRSVDFWRGTLVNVNTTGMFYTFATGISLGTLFANVQIKYKALAAVVLAACIAATVFFANRSLILIVALILIWKGFCWLFDRKTSRRAKVIAVTVSLIALTVFAILITFNVGGLSSWITALKVFQRFTDGENSTRMSVWSHFVEDFNFLRYPFGGDQMLEGTGLSYLHNMWLDVYNVAGVIPFVLLIALTVIFIMRYITFSRVLRRHEKYTEHSIFQCLMLAILFNCAVEPILEANPYYFLIVIMFLGAMEGYRKQLILQEAEGTA